VLTFIRALSTSNTAEVRISDDSLFIDIKHFIDSEESLHDVQSGTIMIGSSVGEIANDEGELYDIDVLKDIIKEMLTKVQL